MRHRLPALLTSALLLSGCGWSSDPAPAPGGPILIVQPDDGRAPILEVINAATSSIRLTIYAITDLESVAQTPAAPAGSIVQALIDKAQRGVSVRVIVDQEQAGSSGNAAKVQATITALRAAGAVVKTSSTAFCFTHQKTFLVDGPTAANPGAPGTAVIMTLNLMPGYFGGTRDYGVITREAGVLAEVARVFESDFALDSPATGCAFAHAPATTTPPPAATDTPALSEGPLVWSPVSSKSKLLALIASTTSSLLLTTEELTDADSVCAVQAVAQSAARPFVRILLSGDTGSNAAAVKHLTGLGLSNLEVRTMPGLPATPSATAPQTPLYMHGKQVLVDGARGWLGSENLTNTSLLQNRELGYLFSDPAMISRLQAAFTADFSTPGASLPAVACTSGSGCTTISCPSPVAGALSPEDVNLIFVVTPDLSFQTDGDVSATTGNLTPQGLQRSLQLAGYLKRQVLGGQNVARIHVLQPMSHPQTAGQYPYMAGVTYLQQFAMLNQVSIPGAGGYSMPLYTANSFPLNTSYAVAGLPVPALPYQGLEFDDMEGHNFDLVGNVVQQGLPGYYVFGAPWETASALMSALDTRLALGLTPPTAFVSSNLVYAISIKPSGTATLTSYDAALSPPTTYPALPAPVATATCPGAHTTPKAFVIQAPNGVAGAGIPLGINTSQTLHLVRHAEAHPVTDWEDGNFVAAGQWRALALAETLRGRISPTEVWSVDPAQVFPNSSLVAGASDYSYVRPSLTIAPYAIANDLPFNLISTIDLFSGGAAGELVQFFFFGGRFSGTTTLLAWEHDSIPPIIKALLMEYFTPANVPAIPTWPDADYDTIWTVTLDAAGNLTVDNARREGIDSSKLPATAPTY